MVRSSADGDLTGVFWCNLSRLGFRVPIENRQHLNGFLHVFGSDTVFLGAVELSVEEAN